MLLLPSTNTRLVPTHQTWCQLENSGFVVHTFHILETNFEFIKSCYGRIVTKLASGCISQLHVSSGLLDREAFIIDQKVISPLPFTVTLTVVPKVQIHRVTPQAQVHFLLRDVALTQLLHAFQLLAHLHVGYMEPIRKGWINWRRCLLKKQQLSAGRLNPPWKCHSGGSFPVLPKSYFGDRCKWRKWWVSFTSCSPPPPKKKQTHWMQFYRIFRKVWVVRRRVDEDDILNDAMAYYKDPTFDHSKRLRVLWHSMLLKPG